MAAVGQIGKKRPGLVWVVFLFYLFFVGYIALSLVLIYSGSARLAPAQAEYFRNLSAFDHAVTILGGALNLAGAISLFCLRKIALVFFGAALALVILNTVVLAAMGHFGAALAGGGAVIAAVGYAIPVAVCAYTWRLKARGILV